MNNDFVIFRNPDLRYRSEEFGGILRLNLMIFLINTKQFDLISNLKKIRLYSDLTDIEKKIVDKLLEKKILFKVTLERAKELGFK